MINVLTFPTDNRQLGLPERYVMEVARKARVEVGTPQMQKVA